MTEHAPSYYAATANAAPERPRLDGDITADVCIVGAGFTGISAGLELAERGYKVVVLEGARVGWGASGRNGGQIVNGYSRELDVIERRYGAKAADGLGQMALEGGHIIRERVAKYAIDCALTPGGAMTALTARQMKHLEHSVKVWARYGHTSLELIDRAGLAPFVEPRIVGFGELLDPLKAMAYPNVSVASLVLGQRLADGAADEAASWCRHADDRSILVLLDAEEHADFGENVLAGAVHRQVCARSTAILRFGRQRVIARKTRGTRQIDIE